MSSATGATGTTSSATGATGTTSAASQANAEAVARALEAQAAAASAAAARAASATGATGTSGTSSATTTTNAGTTAATTPTSSIMTDMATADVYGIFVGIFVFVLSIFVLFSTGSILSVLVLWATIALMVTVLIYYGFIDISKILTETKKAVAPVVPLPNIPGRGNPLVGSEVFYIEQNQFTYDEAPAVCAAYDAELATLEQVIDAYNHGAEWCGYGWSAGGMALYPTQKATWDQLQREVDTGKRTACGRPGVNGGYMDPMLKLGVNCFGFKPRGDFKPPKPVPGTDTERFNEMVGRFRDMLNTMKLSSFNRREWSGYDSALGSAVKKSVEGFWGGGQTAEIPKFTQSFATPYGFVEGMANGSDPFSEAPTTSGYSAAPFGIRGEIGPTGPMSTVGGPTGPAGPIGSVGAAGPAGVAGAQGVAGPTGPQGTPGTASEKVAIKTTAMSTNDSPAMYWARGAGIYHEYKEGGALGLDRSTAGFGYLETVVPWSDSSGGPIQQTYRYGTGRLKRKSNTATPAGWATWENGAWGETTGQ